MNITMDDLHELPKKMFTDRLSKIQTKTNGKLIIKEYPTASAHTGAFPKSHQGINTKEIIQTRHHLY